MKYNVIWKDTKVGEIIEKNKRYRFKFIKDEDMIEKLKEDGLPFVLLESDNNELPPFLAKKMKINAGGCQTDYFSIDKIR